MKLYKRVIAKLGLYLLCGLIMRIGAHLLTHKRITYLDIFQKTNINKA